MLYHYTEDFLKTNTWSICTWFNKPSAFGTYNDIILCKNNQDSEDSQFYLSVVGGTILNIGVGCSSNLNYNYNFEQNIWYHTVATYDGTNLKLYLNGQLVAQTTRSYSRFDTYNFMLNGRSMNAEGTSCYEQDYKLNDVRVYDHVLSIKEIKKISKGLVLHYALDGINETNVPYGYQELEYIESTGTSWINTQTTFNPEIDSCKVIFKANDTTQDGMIFANTGTNYFWFYYYNSGSRVNLYADNGSGQQYIPGIGLDTNKHIGEYNNKHLYIDGSDKGSLSKTYGEGTSIWLFTYGSGSYPFKGRIYYADIVKNGVYKRIFIPAKRLSDNAVGMYDTVSRTFFASSNANFTAGPIIATPNIVIDDSGYNNDGTIYGNIYINGDCPRYNRSSQVIDNGRIVYPFPQLQQFTYSLWFKRNRVSYSNREMLGTGWYGISMELNPNNTLTFRHYINSNTFDVISSTTFTSTDVWYHICLTRTSSGVSSIYVNGVLDKSGTNTNSIIYTATTAELFTYSGNSYQFQGSISDFRIYGTALSANDVLALYNKAGYIDNISDIYSYEFDEIETSKVNVNKNGILTSNSIVEPDSISNASFNNSGITNSKNFYEI